MTECTREHRTVAVGCYLVEDDGTVFVIYAPCEHGIREVSALYWPGETHTAEGKSAAGEGHSNDY